MRIMACDPGRTSDPAGIVGIETKGEFIYVRLAVQCINMPFGKLAQYLHYLTDKVKPDVKAIETNNYGGKLKQLLEKKYNLQMTGISTCASSRTTRAMSKPDTVQYLAKLKQANKILFPSTASPHMQELILQLTEYKSYKTPNGSTTYRRKNGRHDDMASALLICLHIARRNDEERRANV